MLSLAKALCLFSSLLRYLIVVAILLICEVDSLTPHALSPLYVERQRSRAASLAGEHVDSFCFFPLSAPSLACSRVL